MASSAERQGFVREIGYNSSIFNRSRRSQALGGAIPVPAARLRDAAAGLVRRATAVRGRNRSGVAAPGRLKKSAKSLRCAGWRPPGALAPWPPGAESAKIRNGNDRIDKQNGHFFDITMRQKPKFSPHRPNVPGRRDKGVLQVADCRPMCE